MTDRFKGFLVTLDRDIREDDAQPILEALKMIKGVLKVTPYITGMEDYMLGERAKVEICQKMHKFICEDIAGFKIDKR